eukprot:symbB.v1.2.029485.t1/scaffold3229.1/size60639/3
MPLRADGVRRSRKALQVGAEGDKKVQMTLEHFFNPTEVCPSTPLRRETHRCRGAFGEADKTPEKTEISAVSGPIDLEISSCIVVKEHLQHGTKRSREVDPPSVEDSKEVSGKHPMEVIGKSRYDLLITSVARTFAKLDCRRKGQNRMVSISRLELLQTVNGDLAVTEMAFSEAELDSGLKRMEEANKIMMDDNFNEVVFVA